MAHTTVSTPVSTGVFARVQRWLAELREVQANYMEYRRTYRELDRLSDRELADIGLARCDIEEVARFHLKSL